MYMYCISGGRMCCQTLAAADWGSPFAPQFKLWHLKLLNQMLFYSPEISAS
jgi:hypothetical protein